MYNHFESGEYGVDCPCGEGIANLESVVDEDYYEGEMKICKDCERKILLYGSQEVKTALNPQKVLKAMYSGLRRVRPHRNPFDKIKLDMLSLIADYQTGKHWFWDKEVLDGYYVYADQDHYIGFIYWCLDGGKPVLHSLFVEESRRREGHGTKMVENWIRNFGNNTEFKVRDPEEEMKALLENLDVKFEEV